MKHIKCVVRLSIFYAIRAKEMGQGGRFCTEVMEIKVSATTSQPKLKTTRSPFNLVTGDFNLPPHGH
jgi:hypothetical protein